MVAESVALSHRVLDHMFMSAAWPAGVAHPPDVLTPARSRKLKEVHFSPQAGGTASGVDEALLALADAECLKVDQALECTCMTRYAPPKCCSCMQMGQVGEPELI